MTKTLLIGASGGIGGALNAALTKRGSAVSTLSRSQNGLDLTDEDSIKSAFAALDGLYDAVIVATGALEINGARPEKSLSHLDAQALMDQFALTAVGPALVLKHARAILPRKGRSVFAALSARVGSIGDNRLGGWYSYRAAKSALNQLIHTGAIELARTHPQALCICLHPGTVATRFTEKYQSTHPTVPPHEAAENLLRVIDGLTPQDTGGFYDWAGKSIPW